MPASCICSRPLKFHTHSRRSPRLETPLSGFEGEKRHRTSWRKSLSKASECLIAAAQSRTYLFGGTLARLRDAAERFEPSFRIEPRHWLHERALSQHWPKGLKRRTLEA